MIAFKNINNNSIRVFGNIEDTPKLYQDTVNSSKWLELPNYEPPQEPKIDEAEQRKQQRISYLKNRLVKLDEDILRAVIGYEIDVVTVKKEFNEYYTEL